VPVVLQVPIFPLASVAEGSASLEQFADGFVLTKAAIEFFDAAYRADRSDPRGFPILGDHACAPPSLVVTASLDPIRDSGRDYAQALAAAGADFTFLEMKGVTHSFTNLRRAVPSTQADLERIIAAMKAHLGELAP
jgi:acetyl esterase